MNETIKVIDLLKIIANGEEVPKKIKIRDKVYEFKHTTNGTGYVTEDWDWFNNMMFDEELTLNMEVEIIEDKEDINIQGICGLPEWGYDDDDIRRTINELVQAVKHLEKTKEDK